MKILGLVYGVLILTLLRRTSAPVTVVRPTPEHSLTVASILNGYNDVVKARGGVTHVQALSPLEFLIETVVGDKPMRDMLVDFVTPTRVRLQKCFSDGTTITVSTYDVSLGIDIGSCTHAHAVGERMASDALWD